MLIAAGRVRSLDRSNTCVWFANHSLTHFLGICRDIISEHMRT
jgi:hypothetical protein